MDSVQLGYVERWDKPCPQVSMHPDESHVGGIPSYYGKQPLPQPTCGVCGKPLYLVLQIYAETDRERSLIVYGCNNSTCYGNGRAGSWKVFRTQGPAVQHAAPDIPPPTPTPVPAPSFGGSDDDWGAAGAWGSDAAVHEAAAALTASKIDASVLSPVAAEAAGGAAGPSSTSSSASSVAPFVSGDRSTVYTFPCYALDTCEDPCYDGYGDGSGGGVVDSESDSDDDGGSGTSGAGFSSRSAATGAGASAPGSGTSKDIEHAKQLYAQYQQWAGDDDGESGGASNYAAAGSGAAASSFGHDGGDDSDDSGGDGGDDGAAFEEHSKVSKKSHHVSGGDKRAGAGNRRTKKGGSDKGGAAGAGGGGDAGDGGGGGEKYEKVPAKLRYMLKFQEVLKRMPEQVVRYCWDGKPLWPVVPPRAPAKHQHRSAASSSAGRGGAGFRVPACPGCGSQRRFEMQIMPHVLLGLQPEDHTVDIVEGKAGVGGAGAASSAADSKSQQLVGGGGAGAPTATPSAVVNGGMDFLTVLVYSCEASCDTSSEEWCYVVPAED